MGILLTLIAYFLIAILAPIGIVCAIIKAGSFKAINEYFYNIALSLDQTGNVFCKYLFNSLLINKFGYSFGDCDETISHVLGINKLQGHLTWIGKFICWILDGIQKDHVENASKNK